MNIIPFEKKLVKFYVKVICYPIILLTGSTNCDCFNALNRLGNDRLWEMTSLLLIAGDVRRPQYNRIILFKVTHEYFRIFNCFSFWMIIKGYQRYSCALFHFTDPAYPFQQFAFAVKVVVPG